MPLRHTILTKHRLNQPIFKGDDGGGNGYYLDPGRLVLIAVLLAATFAYWAYLKASDAKRNVRGAYVEIHAHRTQTERELHREGWNNGDGNE